MKVEKNERTRSSVLSVGHFPAKLWRLFLGILFISICFLPNSAFAGREKIVLDFDDSYFHAGNGEIATLFLKRELKQQYPWLKVENFHLQEVILVAKSKKGHGKAQLLVGDRISRPERINGIPAQYHDNRSYSFDRVQFHNPSADSDGRWQIDLQGNCVIRRVILVLDENAYRFSRPRYSREWHNNKRNRNHRW